jgi:hypothetical protein
MRPLVCEGNATLGIGKECTLGAASFSWFGSFNQIPSIPFSMLFGW